MLFIAGCYTFGHLLHIEPTQFRTDAYYIFYYVNISQNVVTGLIPLVSLVILNYLVYKHLKERRKGFFNLGMIAIILRCKYPVNKNIFR